MSPRSKLTAAIIAALAATLLGAGAAPGAGKLETGFSDGAYLSSDPAERDDFFERTVDAEAGIVRLNVIWSAVAGGQPSNARNPADPAYDFSRIDGAVRDASERGLKVLITVYSAPAFAEGPNRAGSAPAGTWQPDPGAFGDFAAALASRYSGSFLGLPRVRYFQAWNEPNLSTYLTPQYEGEQAVSTDHYRRMLNAFGDAVKAVHGDNQVVTGGTAPYGDPRGGNRIRPLAFWREVLCLQGPKLKPTSCPTKARFDVLAHHPINTSGGPRRSAMHPDDASTPDLKNVREILRAAERRNTLAGGGRHPLWATELWWDSNPPDNVEGVPLRVHARWIQQALHTLSEQGARVVINLQLQDAPFDREAPLLDNSTGVFFSNGKPKPAFTAFRFPFVVEKAGKGKVRVWGRSPSGGRLVIERKAGGWRKIESLNAKPGEVFQARLRVGRTEKLRARIGGDSSLVWAQR